MPAPPRWPALPRWRPGGAPAGLRSEEVVSDSTDGVGPPPTRTPRTVARGWRPGASSLSRLSRTPLAPCSTPCCRLLSAPARQTVHARQTDHGEVACADRRFACCKLMKVVPKIMDYIHTVYIKVRRAPPVSASSPVCRRRKPGSE